MQVKLAKDWFGPDASLYLTRDNPHNFADEWKKVLPSSAEVLKGKAIEEPAAE